MLDLDAQRAAAPVPPRAAATVLILRDDLPSPDGLEGLAVYVIVRHPRSGFMGGVVAFPGGKVDAADEEAGVAAWTTEPPPRLVSEQREAAPLPASPRALAVAACRECLEEAALLPTVGDVLSGEETRALRARVEEGASLGAELEERAARIDLAALRPFGRWITPVAEARRFDAVFFLLARPLGQEGEHDPRETTGGEWATPQSILDRFARGELQVAPPTLRCLELLTGCATVAAAFALADAQSLAPVRPQLAVAGDSPLLVLPGDPLHEDRHPVVGGPSRFVFRDGRFVSENAPLGAPPTSPRGTPGWR